MSVLVVGIGHPDRGDDAVGPYVVELLAERAIPGVEFVVAAADPSELLLGAAWNRAIRTVLVDAVVTGSPVGTILLLDGLHDDLGRLEAAGTHDLGVATTVALARALRRVPQELTVVGIESGSFVLGAPMSEPVRVAGERVSRRLATMLQPHIPS